MPQLSARTSLAGAALCASLLIGNTAQARDARCDIMQGGQRVVNGVCDFEADGRDGSFALSARNKRGVLFGGVLTVTVSVISPGVAEVRGLTRAGINSRWGEARRARNDPACWTGADFRVCAR